MTPERKILIKKLEEIIEIHQTIISIEQMSIDSLELKIAQLKSCDLSDLLMENIYRICKPK